MTSVIPSSYTWTLWAIFVFCAIIGTPIRVMVVEVLKR